MDVLGIRARGLDVTGLAAGSPSDPLVLLLHGLPRTSWEWHLQLHALADHGFHAVAPDARGCAAGTGPDDVDAYHLDEFCADALAIADASGHADEPFHVVGTSSGAFTAWRLAAHNQHRVRSIAAFNIPHQGAINDVLARNDADGDDQRTRFGYFEIARSPGNERMIFDEAMKRMDLTPDALDPYRRAFADDAVLRNVFHFYRAMPRWSGDPLEPVAAPALFVWPRHWGNIAPATADANANWVLGSYRRVDIDGGQPIAQSDPDTTSRLLIEHLQAVG